MVEALAERAGGAGWPALALVAVNDAAGFWRRHGFEAREAPGMAAKLASYGPDARYMVRPLWRSSRAQPGSAMQAAKTQGDAWVQRSPRLRRIRATRSAVEAFGSSTRR